MDKIDNETVIKILNWLRHQTKIYSMSEDELEAYNLIIILLEKKFL